MTVLYVFITNILLLMMSFACNFDTRRPASERLKYKFRVKDDSIFRKIIKFKDKRFYPCNYFKIVPIYIYIMLSFFSFVFFIIDIVSGYYLSNNYQIAVLLSFSIIVGISIIYVIVIIIWWELVDYKESRFTKEEKQLLVEVKKTKKNNKQ